MKKYTYITDHPRNRISRDKVVEKINAGLPHMDVRQLMKLYAFEHRMIRDKVK